MKKSRKISQQHIRDLAHLASIKLSDKELSKFQNEIPGLLEYVHQINEANTRGVKSQSHVTSKNRFRKDKPSKSLSQKDALSNRTKSSIDGYFTMKSVLDHK